MEIIVRFETKGKKEYFKVDKEKFDEERSKLFSRYKLFQDIIKEIRKYCYKHGIPITSKEFRKVEKILAGNIRTSNGEVFEEYVIGNYGKKC